jgi:hypothetical protein
MTDPKDLQHYLDEKMGEKNKEEQQAQQRADQQDAQTRQAQDRRRAAIELLTDTIIPFLEESKKDMTGAHLVVEPKVTTNHQVIGVTFQVRDRKEGTVRSSVFEIDIGTGIPLVRSRNEADENSAGVDLADKVGIRHFEDLNTRVVARLVKLAIDEYASRE